LLNRIDFSLPEQLARTLIMVISGGGITRI